MSASGSATSQRGFVKPNSDAKLTASDQAVAGSLAKAATKLALYPLDTWKSRKQARRFGETAEFRHLRTLPGVYRGVVPKLLLYSPYQAVYMSAYISARDALSKGPAPFGDSGLTFVAAAVVAEVAGSVIRLPMEVAKLRLQLGAYRNSFHAFQDLGTNLKDLYRGSFLPQTVLHDCSYSACGWLIFETSSCWDVKQQLYSVRGSSDLPVYENLSLGIFTGTLTALVTNPFDVIKTRIIGRPAGTSPPGIVETARSILSLEGLRAFWQGATWRILHLAPSHGVYMLLYEIVKLQLASLRE
eukprot:s3630_g3.t3